MSILFKLTASGIQCRYEIKFTLRLRAENSEYELNTDKGLTLNT